jgi:hypothetical protein
VLGDSLGAKLVTGTLAGIAASATVAELRGGRFSMQQAAADAFGNALGQGLVDEMQPNVPAPASAEEKAAIVKMFEDDGARREDGFSMAAEQRLQTGQTRSDAYGPVNSFNPTAENVFGIESSDSRGFVPNSADSPSADTRRPGDPVPGTMGPKRNGPDAFTDGIAKSFLSDSAVDRVFSKEDLVEMPTWQIQGAGDKGMASAMTVLQGARNPETGAWGINASAEEIDQHLQTIATARGEPLENVQEGFRKFLRLAADREEAATAKAGFRTGAFEEGAEGETRVPLLSMTKASGLPDNSAHMASIEQLRFGKLIGDALGVDPIFGALLSPTGGIAGAGNKEVGGFAYAAGGGKDVVTTHGIAHDAGGYLLNYHNVGPGYQYVPDVSLHILDRTNPLAGQVDGLRFFSNLKQYGSPDGKPYTSDGS